VDAGIVVVDLPARIGCHSVNVFTAWPRGRSVLSRWPGADRHSDLVPLPDDWCFVNSVDAYQWSREGRVLERAARPACDFRAILFGRPLLQFIVNAYLSLPGEIASLLSSPAEVDDEAEQDALANR